MQNSNVSPNVSNIHHWKKLNFMPWFTRNLPTGPYKLAIIPLGKATDWNFRAWTHL